MTDSLKQFADAQDKAIYAPIEPTEPTEPINDDTENGYHKRKIEFHNAIIQFQENFEGLIYNKTMKVSEYSQFRYVTHAQLIKLISKELAKQKLGHYSSQTLKNGILEVRVTLFHENGFEKHSYYEFPFSSSTFSDGVKHACTKYQYNSDNKKLDKISSMKYLHELAKAGALAHKYGLQALLGIAGGEVDDEGEKLKTEPALLKPVDYEQVLEQYKKKLIDNDIGKIPDINRISCDVSKTPQLRLEELRKYAKKQVKNAKD